MSMHHCRVEILYDVFVASLGCGLAEIIGDLVVGFGLAETLSGLDIGDDLERELVPDAYMCRTGCIS